MNTIIKAARASPIQPAPPTITPAGNKAFSAAFNFAELLGSAMKKGQSQVTTSSPAEKEPPEAEIPTKSKAAQDLANPLNAVTAMPVVPVPPQPSEPVRSSGETSGDANPAGQAGSPAVGAADAAQTSAANATGSSPAGTVQSAPVSVATAPGEVMNSQLAAAFKAAMQGALPTAVAAEQPQAGADPAKSQPADQAKGDKTPAQGDPAQATKTAQGDVQVKSVPQTTASTAARASLNDLTIPAPARQPEAQTTGPVSTNPATSADPLQAARVQSSTVSKAAATAAETTENTVAAAPAGAKAVDPSSYANALQASGSPGSTAATNIEPARLAEAQAKGMVTQVSQNIEALIKTRQSTMRVMLFPADMGRIDLRLTTGSGGLGINLVAQEASTGHMLETQLAQLRQALDNAGIHLAHLSVGQQRSQAGSGQSSDRQQSGQNAQRGPTAVGATELDNRLTIASLEPSEGYDLRV